MFTNKEIDSIKARTTFLLNKDFKFIIKDTNILLKSSNICFHIYIEKEIAFYSDILVEYNKEVSFYSLTVMEVLTNTFMKPISLFDHVLNLLDYLEQDYEQITSYKYCTSLDYDIEKNELKIEEAYNVLEKVFKEALPINNVLN
ncbi:MAG: hypothetical protein RR646_04980 [Erysipelotrichaceae bacterium]